MTICSFKRFHSIQVEYDTKDHIETNVYKILKVKMALFFSSLLALLF